MKRSSVAQVEDPPLSDSGWDHEGRIIWIDEAYPSVVEGLLLDNHNADESEEENFDEYSRDDCMSDKHWNSSDICDLEIKWTILIRVWNLRNIIHITIDMGQKPHLNFQKFKINKFYSKISQKYISEITEIDWISFIAICLLTPSTFLKTEILNHDELIA